MQATNSNTGVLGYKLLQERLESIQVYRVQMIQAPLTFSFYLRWCKGTLRRPENSFFFSGKIGHARKPFSRRFLGLSCMHLRRKIETILMYPV